MQLCHRYDVELSCFADCFFKSFLMGFVMCCINFLSHYVTCDTRKIKCRIEECNRKKLSFFDVVMLENGRAL
jgi:hypothetical protein